MTASILKDPSEWRYPRGSDCSDDSFNPPPLSSYYANFNDRRGVTFRDDEVSDVFLVLRHNREDHSDLFYTREEFEKIISEYHKDKMKEAVMKWLPGAKGVKKLLKGNKSKREEMEMTGAFSNINLRKA